MCPSCIVDGQYIRAGGTSMAAPMVAGAIADMLEKRPGLDAQPGQGGVLANGRNVGGSSLDEVSVNNLVFGYVPTTNPNAGLTPSTLIDSATGGIDYSKSRWSKSRWSRSSWSRSSWSRSSWSCACSRTSSGSIDPTRSSWSRSSWSMSWTK